MELWCFKVLKDDIFWANFCERILCSISKEEYVCKEYIVHGCVYMTIFSTLQDNLETNFIVFLDYSHFFILG